MLKERTGKTKLLGNIGRLLLAVGVEPVLGRLSDGASHLNRVAVLSAEHTEKLTSAIAVRRRRVLKLVVSGKVSGPDVGILLEGIIPGKRSLADLLAGFVNESEALDLVGAQRGSLDHAESSKANGAGSDDRLGEHLDGVIEWAWGKSGFVKERRKIEVKVEGERPKDLVKDLSGECEGEEVVRLVGERRDYIAWRRKVATVAET